MNERDSKTNNLAAMLTFAIVPAASADLTGMGFNMTSEYTGSGHTGEGKRVQ